MILRAYVLDDERLAVERLERMLRQSGRVDVVGRSTDPEEALAFLNSNTVDVLFIDIQMPGMTGFDVLREIATPIPVIFTTAYDHYALEAFSANSIDYLLKPIEVARLNQSLDKLGRLTGPPVDARLLARELASRLTSVRRLERIASRVGERVLVLDVSKVSYFMSRDKLTLAVSQAQSHVVDHTLAELEARLDPRRFARIHRSVLINLASVKELYPGVDGMLVKVKDDGTELPVARDRVRELRERLGI